MGDRNKEKELLSHHLFGLFSLTKCCQKSIEGAFATTSGANRLSLTTGVMKGCTTGRNTKLPSAFFLCWPTNFSSSFV
jgi:hypothetical protein